jgi:putative transposase
VRPRTPCGAQVRRHERADAKRLRELETENARLKKLLAESMLENEVTREALRKKW